MTKHRDKHQDNHHHKRHNKRLVVPIVGLTMAGLLAPTGAAFANDTVVKTSFGNVAVASKSGKTATNVKSVNTASAKQVTAENGNGWVFDTEFGSHHTFTSDGLLIKTETGDDKSAGAWDVGSVTMREAIQSAEMDYTPISGAAPGIQLTFYVDGKWGGNLVWEEVEGHWWSTRGISAVAETMTPVEGSNRHEIYDIGAFLDAVEASNSKFEVRYAGYGLGRGPVGEAVIRSISVAGTTYAFGVQVEAGALAINGTPKVGHKLQATVGDNWKPADVTIPMKYEWKDAATSSVLGTGSTYIVKQADAGKRIVVTAVGGGSGQLFESTSVTSDAVTVQSVAAKTVLSTNVDQNGWVFEQEQPRFEYEPGGLRISSTLTEKSSGYVPISALSLRDATATTSIDYVSDKGYPPGINLTFYVDGQWGGNLVWEEVEGHWWSTRSVPGAEATLEQTGDRRYEIRDLDAFLTAVEEGSKTIDVRALGYSLGSGVEGQGVLRSIGVAGTTYTFGAQVEAGTVAIDGTLQVGQTLKATLANWKYAQSTTFEWKVAGSSTVLGTGTTYTVKPADAGKQITVTATGTADGYVASSKVSAASAAIATAPFASAPTPTVSGTPKVGVKLTASAGTWSPSAKLSYQWYQNGSAIKGATSSTFTPTATQRGATITVQVKGTAAGYTTVTKSSAATKAVAAGTFSQTPTPKVAGTAKVDSKLTASTGTWSPNAKLSYQWYQNGSAIKGATKSAFTPTATQRGAKITVQVKGTAAGYTTVTKASPATKTVAAGTFTKAPAPKIAGTAKVGSKLTAQPGVSAPTAKIGYQWKVDGKAVKGATKSTFTPRAADRGKKVTVTTQATRAGYTTVTKTSAAKKVAAGTLGQTAKPKVVGTAKVGNTLRASTGSYKVKPTSVTYQWRVNGKAVKGLTSPAYTPTAKAVTGKVSVTVTVKKAGFTTITSTSAMTPKVTR